jgi:hypothetical protein
MQAAPRVDRKSAVNPGLWDAALSGQFHCCPPNQKRICDIRRDAGAAMMHENTRLVSGFSRVFVTVGAEAPTHLIRLLFRILRYFRKRSLTRQYAPDDALKSEIFRFGVGIGIGIGIAIAIAIGF